MRELVQLEKTHDEFAKRNVRVIITSVEGTDDAKKTQAQFPHLFVLSDESQGLTNAVQVIHKGAHPNGSDVDAPTTLIIDRTGKVRWLFRPDSVFRRLSTAEEVEQIEKLKS